MLSVPQVTFIVLDLNFYSWKSIMKETDFSCFVTSIFTFSRFLRSLSIDNVVEIIFANINNTEFVDPQLNAPSIHPLVSHLPAIWTHHEQLLFAHLNETYHSSTSSFSESYIPAALAKILTCIIYYLFNDRC